EPFDLTFRQQNLFCMPQRLAARKHAVGPNPVKVCVSTKQVFHRSFGRGQTPFAIDEAQRRGEEECSSYIYDLWRLRSLRKGSSANRAGNCIGQKNTTIFWADKTLQRFQISDSSDGRRCQVHRLCVVGCRRILRTKGTVSVSYKATRIGRTYRHPRRIRKERSCVFVFFKRRCRGSPVCHGDPERYRADCFWLE